MMSRFGSGALVAAAMLLATGARATVVTSAYTTDNESAAFNTAGYNARYDSGVRETGLFGATSSSSPGFNCPTCTGTQAGTTTPGTNATAATDGATTTAAGATGTAYARADLRTAQLGVAATSGAHFGGGGYLYSVSGDALAQFGDGLDFTVAGATAATVTDIDVVVDLHGALNASSFAQITELLRLSSPGYADAQFTLQALAQLNRPAAITTATAGGWVSYAFDPLSPEATVFHGVYALTGASQHVDLGLSLEGQASIGVADYAHTSEFRFILPRGTTFTSDSGAFLAGVGGVPEPATWALLVAGFGAVGVAARRRGAAVAA